MASIFRVSAQGDGLTNDNIGIPSRFSSLGKGRVLAVVFTDSGRNWQAGVQWIIPFDITNAHES